MLALQSERSNTDLVRTSSEPSYGALARLDAMLAGHPEWWTVTQWPLAADQSKFSNSVISTT